MEGAPDLWDHLRSMYTAFSSSSPYVHTCQLCGGTEFLLEKSLQLHLNQIHGLAMEDYANSAHVTRSAGLSECALCALPLHGGFQGLWRHLGQYHGLMTPEAYFLRHVVQVEEMLAYQEGVEAHQEVYQEGAEDNYQDGDVLCDDIKQEEEFEAVDEMPLECNVDTTDHEVDLKTDEEHFQSQEEPTAGSSIQSSNERISQLPQLTFDISGNVKSTKRGPGRPSNAERAENPELYTSVGNDCSFCGKSFSNR